MKCLECGSENVDELPDGSYKCLDCGHRFDEDEVVVREEVKEEEEEREDKEWEEDNEEMDEEEDFGLLGDDLF